MMNDWQAMPFAIFMAVVAFSFFVFFMEKETMGGGGLIPSGSKRRSRYGKLDHCPAQYEFQPLEKNFQSRLYKWIAIAFDFYIMAQDYSVKRIGAFLGAVSLDPMEKHWERWVAENRDPFAPWATPVLSTLVYIGAVLIGSQQPGVSREPLFKLWLIVTFLPIWLAFAYYRFLRGRAPESDLQDDQPIFLQVITEVETANHQMTLPVYRKIAQFFVKCQTDLFHQRKVRQMAKEYEKRESLLCVDQEGGPIDMDGKVIQDFRQTLARYPGYKNWFQEDTLPDGQMVLLVARWLCHLLGLRHRAVHLFIDHPTLTDHTLIQVRATNKAESPACFDLPVAGHLTGVESVEAALHKELAEELGLETDSIYGLEKLGSYAYRNLSDPSGFRQVEHRTVFYARLGDDAWLQAGATDGEVAAIATFSIVELQQMMTSFPERVALGLSGSFSYYLKYKL